MTAVDNVNRSNHYGNAAIGQNESAFARALSAPVLLFRPFIWEVHNLPSTLASIEGLLLLLFTWRRRRELFQVLRRSRIDSFAAFLLIYTVQFSVIFAGAMSNFGLLARQRVMLLPFTLMLLAAVSPSFEKDSALVRGRLTRANIWRWKGTAPARVTEQ